MITVQVRDKNNFSLEHHLFKLFSVAKVVDKLSVCALSAVHQHGTLVGEDMDRAIVSLLHWLHPLRS